MSEPPAASPPAPAPATTPPADPPGDPSGDPAGGPPGGPSAAVAPAPLPCPNCGAAVAGPYCAQCGQAQRDRLRVSLPRLLGEGLEELLDVDARVAVTLRRLLARPGLLTAEYLAGRRARYVRPLRLYLTASILYFVVLSLQPGGALRTDEAGVSTYGNVLRLEPGVARADSLARADSTTRIDAAAGTDSLASPVAAGGGVGGFVAARLTRFGQLSVAERGRIMRDAILRHLPKALFALVPLFALLLAMLRLRRDAHYAEHLIFALHLHAFVFLVSAAREALPTGAADVVGPLVLGWVLVYAFLALRRVYGRSRRRTLAALALLLPAYAVALMVAMLSVVFAAMLLA